jgi:hypothetical protein
MTAEALIGGTAMFSLFSRAAARFAATWTAFRHALTLSAK